MQNLYLINRPVHVVKKLLIDNEFYEKYQHEGNFYPTHCLPAQEN